MKHCIAALLACAVFYTAGAQQVQLKRYKTMPGVTEDCGDFLLHYNMSAIMYAYHLLPHEVQAAYKLPQWMVNRKINLADGNNKVIKDLLDNEVGAYLLLSGLAVVETKRWQQIHTLTAKEVPGANPSHTRYSFAMPGTGVQVCKGALHNSLKTAAVTGDIR